MRPPVPGLLNDFVFRLDESQNCSRRDLPRRGRRASMKGSPMKGSNFDRLARELRVAAASMKGSPMKGSNCGCEREGSAGSAASMKGSPMKGSNPGRLGGTFASAGLNEGLPDEGEQLDHQHRIRARDPASMKGSPMKGSNLGRFRSRLTGRLGLNEGLPMKGSNLRPRRLSGRSRRLNEGLPDEGEQSERAKRLAATDGVGLNEGLPDEGEQFGVAALREQVVDASMKGSPMKGSNAGHGVDVDLFTQPQ